MERRISRREFGKRLARVTSGAALLALHPSCTSTQPSLSKGQLLRNDLTDLSGTLLLDDAARQAAADDFGHIVRRLPLAVLKPGSVQDIVKLLQFANRRDLKVAIRGNGHAMFGQTQVEGGVVIDSSTLNSVRVINSGGRRVVETSPGALWGSVLDAPYAEKLTPPVNVDTGVLSVGGTISTSGFGGATWRHGFQVDHVLELQVVTGHGELVSCSDEHNRELFNAVLAGMGQCSIIVKVVMALVPAPTHVLFFVLNYNDLQTATADLTFLVNDGRFNHLEGRTAARPGGGFTYQLEAGVFYDAPKTPSESQLLAGLKSASPTARVMTYTEYYRRVPGRLPPLPHPWLYLCLPASRFVEYATRVFASPAEAAFATPRFSVWRRNSMKRPLARLPSEDLVARFQVSRQPPASFTDIDSLVRMNRTLYERAREMGGTRLTSTAIPFSQADWIQHYGPVWESFRAAKNRFDPNNVLTPGEGMFPSAVGERGV
jgi:cytokinin dehydrogenase